MALLIQLQWPKFGYKRATLFGKGKVPISLTNLGPLCIIRFDIRHAEAFSDFLEANVSLDDYLAERAPRVRLAAKRATAKARVEERESARSEVDYWRDVHSRDHAQIAQLQQRNYKLEVALDAIRTLDAARAALAAAKPEGDEA